MFDRPPRRMRRRPDSMPGGSCPRSCGPEPTQRDAPRSWSALGSTAEAAWRPAGSLPRGRAPDPAKRAAPASSGLQGQGRAAAWGPVPRSPTPRRIGRRCDGRRSGRLSAVAAPRSPGIRRRGPDRSAGEARGSSIRPPRARHGTGCPDRGSRTRSTDRARGRGTGRRPGPPGRCWAPRQPRGLPRSGARRAGRRARGSRSDPPDPPRRRRQRRQRPRPLCCRQPHPPLGRARPTAPIRERSRGRPSPNRGSPGRSLPLPRRWWRPRRRTACPAPTRTPETRRLRWQPALPGGARRSMVSPPPGSPHPGLAACWPTPRRPQRRRRLWRRPRRRGRVPHPRPACRARTPPTSRGSSGWPDTPESRGWPCPGPSGSHSTAGPRAG
jgi:hypothetical protein